jgi:hypothetical protein
MEKRVATRKTIEGITVTGVTALSPVCLIAREALLINASATGFLLTIHRKALVPKELRANLSLEKLEGESIMMTIEQMNIDIDGYIARTKLVGNGVYEIAVNFTDDAPSYWLECLYDLLPGVGEMDEH